MTKEVIVMDLASPIKQRQILRASSHQFTQWGCPIQSEISVGHLWRADVRNSLPCQSVFLKCQFCEEVSNAEPLWKEKKHFGFLLLRSLFSMKRTGKINIDLGMKQQVIRALKSKYYLGWHQIINHRDINHMKPEIIVDKCDFSRLNVLAGREGLDVSVLFLALACLVKFIFPSGE